MTIQRPRILLIDSYDSFTYNLAALCRKAIPGALVYIIQNDELSTSTVLAHLDLFSAIVVGPGPGSPEVLKDIGIVKDLWTMPKQDTLPIFGVCLGLQSLGVELGARLRRLPVVKHGQVSRIHHTGTDIFAGLGEVEAVRYHSLCVEPHDDDDLETLAWAHDKGENGTVVMALKHKSKPFWAVQYHPESVRTDAGGVEVLRNFWKLAEGWSRTHSRKIRAWDLDAKETFGSPWPHTAPPEYPSVFASHSSDPSVVQTKVLDAARLNVMQVCERLGADMEGSPFVLLDSAAQPGRWSIIGVIDATAVRIAYSVGESFVRLTVGEACCEQQLGRNDIWSWLEDYMRAQRAVGGVPHVPFWGGLIGYLSYELGVYTLPTHLPLTDPRRHRHDDVNLVFVKRSLVFDSVTGKLYVQSVVPDDDMWFEEVIGQVKAVNNVSDLGATDTETIRGIATQVVAPDKDLYISRVKQAKEFLFAGDSYELCLTAPTRIIVTAPASSSSSSSSSWERYKHLRKTNPAPHSAYIRLNPTTILSSSPERFLSFSRSPGSVCQLRPIKGTVRKAPGITRAVAEQLLAGSVKEVAENLMIVDLIRHDLHGVVGDDVQVKQFCKVEEYETVWQLVSVIEGRLDKNDPRQHDGSSLGVNVLKNSLPPGSMTGAPKKRSVELLQTIEDDERGIYSGVLGYWCVSGGGDWAVTIRSCFKHDSDSRTQFASDPEDVTEEWTVGAGGAITALSDPEAEWEEMLVKLQSVLRAFGVPR